MPSWSNLVFGQRGALFKLVAKHLENSYSYDIERCGKVTKSRNGLATHKSRDHVKQEGGQNK